MNNLSLLEQLCFSTTRIETEDSEGKQYSGTGFFYNLAIGNQNIPLIITNKHVVKNMKKGLFRLTRSDLNGDPDYTNHWTISYESDFEKMWHFHPDNNVDLCALPIALLLEAANMTKTCLFYKCFNNELIPSKDLMENMDVMENIIMIGYPNGLWDSVNNMPIIRRGVTATSVALDYEGRKEFLIDAACFPGSSGSPVIMYNAGGYTDKAGNLTLGERRFSLLGILYAGPQSTITGDIKVVTIPTVQQKAVAQSHIPINLGCVIKSEKLLDFKKLFAPILTVQNKLTTEN